MRSNKQKSNLRRLIPNLAVSGILLVAILMLSLFGPLKSESVAFAQAGSCPVAIDPGHGGSDPGAERNGIQEKDVVWNVSNRVANILRSKGYPVTLTRAENENPPFGGSDGRVARAKKVGAKVLVSVHANAHDSSTAHGVEAWYQGPRANESQELARLLANTVSSRTGLYNRGVKVGKSPYSSAMPSALIELAFLSNPNERAMLVNNPGLFAQAVADAIVSFLGSECDSGTSNAQMCTYQAAVQAVRGSDGYAIWASYRPERGNWNGWHEKERYSYPGWTYVTLVPRPTGQIHYYNFAVYDDDANEWLYRSLTVDLRNGCPQSSVLYAR